jgi:hypothetical protein
LKGILGSVLLNVNVNRHIYDPDLLQLRVLGFGLLQDGNVGVGVFPEGEEIFVVGESTHAGGIGIRSKVAIRLPRYCGVLRR